MIVDAQDLIQTTLLGEAGENAPVGIFVADDEMGYVAANRFACELLGYEREELLALTIPDVTPGAPSLQEYAAMIAHGELTGRSRLRRKDGTEIEVEYWAFSTQVAQMTVFLGFARPLAEPA